MERQDIEIKLDSTTPNTGYRRSVFFNKFRIYEIEGGHRLVRVGLSVGDSGLVDEAAFLFSKNSLQANKDTLVPYLQQYYSEYRERSGQQYSGFTGAVDQVFTPTVLVLSNQQSEGEMILLEHVFFTALQGQQKGSNLTRPKSTAVPPMPLAVFRSNTADQAALMWALYK